MIYYTRITCVTLIALFGQSFYSQQVRAQDDDIAELLNIIQAVSQGWGQADGTPFREHFLDVAGARYIESGGQNVGLGDLVENHVIPEGAALDNLELTFSDVETHIQGDFAWAIAATEFKATAKKNKREIHHRGYQTFLFRRVDDEWKVVHTHISSKSVNNESGH